MVILESKFDRTLPRNKYNKQVFNIKYFLGVETWSPSHGPSMSELEASSGSSSGALPAEVAETSVADAEMAEKKRLAAERRKKLLDQVSYCYLLKR